MKTTVLALAAGILSLAASASAWAEQPQPAPAEVVMKETGAGWLLTDAKGMTLYTFDRDKPGTGVSTCTDQAGAGVGRRGRTPSGEATTCAKAWPALLAGADAKPMRNWTLVERGDGMKQWAYKGRPLYTYAKDAYVGATYGDNVQTVWHVAYQPIDTPREVTIFSDVTGARMLADGRGMVLYTRTKDTTEGPSPCTGACAEMWTPVSAPWAALSFGDWTAVKRGGGIKQWAYKGKPLYTYAGDNQAGIAAGANIDKAWQAAVLDAGPGLPSWITTRRSDIGVVLADAKGMTVYGFMGDMEMVKKKSCDDACIKAHMVMVSAPSDTKPIGNWSAVPAGENGETVWAYKGSPVFTYTKDRVPGDIAGDKFASGAGKGPSSGGWWRPILRSCLCSPTGTEAL